jgi:hypothetical protein
MRHRAQVLTAMLRLSFRADRRLTVLAGALVAVNAVGVAATGLAQRWLVDAAGSGAQSVTRLVMAAALGALAYVVTSVAMRLQINLRDDLSDRVEITLNHEILSTASPTATWSPLVPRRSRQAAVWSRSIGAPSGYCWSAAVGSAPNGVRRARCGRAAAMFSSRRTGRAAAPRISRPAASGTWSSSGHRAVHALAVAAR